MTRTTSRFGLFCHKRLYKETLVGDPVCARKRNHLHQSFLMCGAKQTYPTLTLKKLGSRNELQTPSLGCAASREIGNPKSDTNLINNSRNRDDTRSAVQIHEPSKITHMLEQTHQQGYCCPMVVRSGKLYSKKRARASDEVVVFSGQKRRKLDDQNPVGRVHVDNESESAPLVSSCDIQEPPAVILNSGRNINTSRLVRRVSQTESPGMSLMGERQNMPEASQTFLLVLDKRLRVMFVSENVSKHLGYQQADMLGRSIEYFVRSKDLKATLKHAIDGQFRAGHQDSFPLCLTPKMFRVSMKFCFQGLESSLQDTGYMQVRWNVTVRLKTKGQGVRVQDLVVLCRPVRTDSILSMPSNENTLITYHDLSFDFIAYHPKFAHLIGREPGDLRRGSEYSFQCCWDVLTCKQCYERLILTGISGTSKSINHKYGVWKRLISQASITYNTRHNPQFLVCKHYFTRCEGAEQKDSYGMDSSDVNKLTELPLVDLAVLNYLTMGNNIKPERTTSDFFLKQLPAPSHLHFQVICFPPSKQQRNIKKMSYNNACSVPAKSWAIMVPESFRNVGLHLQLANSSVPDCGCSSVDEILVSLDKSCSSSSTLNSKHLIDADIMFHNVDVQLKSVTSMSNKSVRRCPALDMHSGKEHHSHSVLPAQITTSINCFSQASDFSDILNPVILMDTSTDQHQTISDELASGKSPMSDDSKPSWQSATDITAAGNMPNITSDKESEHDAQSRKSLKEQSIQSSTQSVLNNNNRSDLLTSSTYKCSRGCLLPLLAYDCQNEVSWDITGQCTTDMSSRIIPNQQSASSFVSKKSKDFTFLNNRPMTRSHDMISKSEAIPHNIETDGTHSTSATSKTLCNTRSSSVEISQTIAPSFSVNSSGYNWTLPSVSSQILSSSTSSLAQDFCTPSNNHSQNEFKMDNINISMFTESKITQSEKVSKVDNVISKMTNKKSDPFLSQASFSELNSHTGTDIFDDLASMTSSVTSPLLSCVTSQNAFIESQVKQSHLRDQYSSRNYISLMDSTESTPHISFTSEDLTELNSFLNTIPLSPCLTKYVSDVTNTQTKPSSEWPESDIYTSPGSVSNDSSDSETSSRPSLLRTLLDKEGSVIQGPQTYTEWTLEQVSKENSEVKKIKTCNTDSIHTVYRNTRCSKNTIRKSTELPKLRRTQRHMLTFGRDCLQVQKPTKELPLPSSVKAAVTKQSSVCEFSHEKSLLDEENNFDDGLNFSEISDFSLPDDLLDMAMEYCTPLETDQTDALISDLNDSCSWEDNLYSLLERSVQEKSLSVSGKQNNKHQSGELVSLQISKSSSMSTLPRLQTKRKSTEDNVENNLLHAQSSFNPTIIPYQSLLTLPQPNPCGLNVCPTDTINMKSKMSLLRAAITSPDVDKLIEQIPLGKPKNHNGSLQVISEHPENDPDIAITKVIGLQKSQALPSVHIPHGRPKKIPSGIIIRPPKKMTTYKYIPGHSNSITASDSPDSVQSEHVFTTSLPKNDFKMLQILPTGPSSAQPGNITETPPSTKSLVIKVKLGSNSSTTKATTVNSGSQNSISKKLKSVSEHRSSGYHTIPRGAGDSNSCLSFTHPVSVMIVRKENHRSRRCKNIAIQTDNEPDEIYPEFEHSHSDIILSPSVSYPHVVSPYHDTSPLSIALSSPSSVSELEKLLLCHSSSEDSSSSADDDYRLTASTPFLLKLLTGELSNDCYQRLDKQLLDQEKQKSVTL